jgi:hypothetical protein
LITVTVVTQDQINIVIIGESNAFLLIACKDSGRFVHSGILRESVVRAMGCMISLKGSSNLFTLLGFELLCASQRSTKKKRVSMGLGYNR